MESFMGDQYLPADLHLNSKLKAIPNLLNDLQIIYKLELKTEVKDDMLDSSKEESQENSDGHQSSQEVLPVFNQDLNCRPLDENTTELIDNKTNVESLPGFGAKKRRAQSDHIAKIALPDLVEYFDVPIVEALRNLNIGLTVLKKKCRW
ncbi:protein RKD5-like [Arachis ipaensis]|uniref:protein RKD5-like n=1 Tax=Arachis ipaensis TaxID=130454 RepID=UPI000A2B9355|nr:protein RKD5-like [Arachis ipaensis]